MDTHEQYTVSYIDWTDKTGKIWQQERRDFTTGQKTIQWTERGVKPLELVYAKTLQHGSGTLVVVEGSKAADYAYEHTGYDAFAIVASSQVQDEDVLTEWIVEKEYDKIVFWSDADTPGRRAMGKMEGRLRGMGISCLGRVDTKAWDFGFDCADLPGEEVKLIVDGIVIDGGTGTAQEVLNPWLQSAADLMKRTDIPDKEDYIVDLMLLKGGVTIIGGMPDTGKSMLTTDMAIASGTGQPFLGQQTKPAHWVFMDFENGQVTLKRRLRGLGRGRGLDVDKDPLDPVFETHIEVPEHMYFPVVGGLMDQKNLDGWLLRLTACDVLVVDSLFKAMGGQNENDAQVISAMHKALHSIKEQTGCAILVIHHVTKEGDPKNMLKWLRGSGAITGEPDIVLMCRKLDHGRTLSHAKLRTEPGEKVWDNREYTIQSMTDGGIRITTPQGTPPVEVTIDDESPEHADDEHVEEDEDDPLAEKKDEIVRYLKRRYEWCSTTDIKKAVPGNHMKIVQALYELVEADEIKKNDQGDGKPTVYLCEPF